MRLKSFAPVILLLCALLTAAFSLYGDGSYSKMRVLQRSLEGQRLTNFKLKQTVDQLRRQVHGIKNDPRMLEKAARNELGLADPSDIIFVFDQVSESDQP